MLWVCKKCGANYEPNSNAQKYCSDECRRLAHNERNKIWKIRTNYKAPCTYFAQPMKTKICEECGEAFRTNRSNTVCCSNECRKQRQKRLAKENQEYYRRWDKKIADNNN